MTQKPTWDETIVSAVRTLSEAAGVEVDRQAVAEKIDDAVYPAQFRVHGTCPAARSDTRGLFKRALKQVQKLRGTLKSIGGKKHRDVLESALWAAYADLPNIHEEVDAANERLPQEVRQESPATHVEIAAKDFLRLEQELKRFEPRWAAVVSTLDDKKDSDGRPSKPWKRRLVHRLETVYEDFVGAKPPRSNRGPFVDLCKAVFKFLEPGGQHQDVGSTVKKALMKSTELVGT